MGWVGSVGMAWWVWGWWGWKHASKATIGSIGNNRQKALFFPAVLDLIPPHHPKKNNRQKRTQGRAGKAGQSKAGGTLTGRS